MLPTNFLQLCQLVRSKVQFSGTGPSSVENQVGEMARVVTAVQQAWLEIQQSERYWLFMNKTADSQTLAGRSEYLPGDLNAENLGNINAVYCQQMPITVLPAAEFVSQFQFDNQQGQPLYCTRAANGKVLFHPKPNDAYAIRLDYQAEPQLLMANLDKPEGIKQQHYMTIVWLATMDLAQQESDSDVYQHAVQGYNNALSSMQRDHLPTMQFAHL